MRDAGANPRLVLASGSPRRREMLRRLGVEFEVRPVDIDETPIRDEPPDAYVSRLAVEKAAAAAASDDESAGTSAGTPAGRIFLAADTIVALDGALLSKPRDESDARRMLERLSGRWHQVLTGVAVLDPARELRLQAVEQTRVRFAQLSAREVAWYAASGEPLDKAGAYAIQGLGALFVERVEGNYSNVVGLPLPLTYRLLREAGYSLLGTSCS